MANPRRTIRSDTLGSIAVRAGAMLLNLLISVILARAIGARSYGVYSFALSVASLLAIPSTAALATLVVREVAGAAAHDRWDLLSGVERWALRRAFAASIVVGAGALCVFLVRHPVDPEWRATRVVALILIPIMSVNAVRASILRGLHHVIISQLPEQIAVPTFMLMLLAAMRVAVPEQTVDAVWAIMLHVIAALAALILGGALLLARRPAALRGAQPVFQNRAWWAAAIPLLFLSGVRLVSQELGVLLLGSLAGPAQVGVYRVTVRGAELVSFALAAINVAIAPRLAEAHVLGDLGRLRSLVRAATLAALVWAVPVAVVMIGGGALILEAVFGHDFVAGSTSLAILSVGQLVNALTGPLGLLLNMTGRERAAVRGQAIGAVLNLVLGVLLIPRWGATGAAAATAAGLVTANAIFALEARRL
jgi:O-antigen/teichoic acid export membrane protein